jgi:enterochelin esterase family protein
MHRSLLVLLMTLAASAPALAQDMPLSQILIDGEGWRKVEGTPQRPKEGPGVRVGIDGGKHRMTLRVGDRELTLVESGTPLDVSDAGPHAVILTSDGATAYVGYPGRKAIWAFRVDKGGRLSDGEPYCPLRLGRAQSIEVTDLATDKDGRIYAATYLGVQVFDPTGRLCGVLTPAAPGRPEHLAFEGDRLTLWVGDAKYERKLSTRGAK